jgi:FAD/FMN-containing dehydrogenase
MWTSWGKIQHIDLPKVPFSPSVLTSSGDHLAIGNLRSYGDSCLINPGTAISMLNYDFFLEWNSQSGRLRVCGGVLLADILQRCVPDGWFLPVVPGTKFVTVGGAIANDIHGKNQHKVGNFGHFVLELELLRSDGEAIKCSPNQNASLFYATIGGLGLTGIILNACVQMIPIRSSMIDTEIVRFNGLHEFFELSANSLNDDYSVAWIDCVTQSRGRAQARGHYIRGRHAQSGTLVSHSIGHRRNVPFEFPGFMLNRATVGFFNTVYYHRQFFKKRSLTQHYDPFFYPLDSVLNWNRIYGKRGLYQYQCVIPLGGRKALQEILDCISVSGQASFLSVLKTFGTIPSLGMLSFPREGMTLCLDFANRGQSTLALFDRLDDIVRQIGGRLYPAKDSRMSSLDFKTGYPQWQSFLQYKDPSITSCFWKRVMGYTHSKMKPGADAFANRSGHL